MSYGQVTVNGVTYIERVQIFPLEVQVANSGQIITGQRVVLPGVANFRLKGLTRTVVKSNAVTTACPFKFRLGNSDGSTWYSQGGVTGTLGSNSPAGGSIDRVLDSLMFGSGQFPYPLIPSLYYSASGAILYEVEDISSNAPYTIYFGFHGSYLLQAPPSGSSGS
jgi:hypothetical protein